jgi:serine/threonine protein kinase
MISDEGQALLTDFGFARVADNSMSLTGSALIGTPAYMSPEQCRGEEATPLSDQYALGVILYQMATGTLPYEAETPMGVVIMHATEPIPPPRSVDPELPEDIEVVILKALQKKPKDRYPSLVAFNEAVQFAISGRRRPHAAGLSGSDLFGHPTEMLEGLSTRLLKSYMRLRNWVQTQPSAIFLILVAFLSILWAIFGWRENGVGAVNYTETPIIAMMPNQEAALRETIQALSTANAPLEGTVLAPGAFETAVAGTLEVFLATASSEALVDIPILTEEGATATPTPSPTYFLFYFSPTPTRSGSIPTTLPGDTPGPTLSNTPTPSLTQLTSTSTPSPSEPTHTPSPIPPTFTFTPEPTKKKCLPGVPTDHPLYCTPTPTP